MPGLFHCAAGTFVVGGMFGTVLAAGHRANTRESLQI
jgi:hypothetical protein